MRATLFSTRVFIAISAIAIPAISAHAQYVAVTGDLSATSLGGGNYSYTLVLNNTGPEDVNALWLGWIPGQFNIANPSNPNSLQGWYAYPAGNSIEFDGTYYGTPISGNGGTGTFTFDSTSTPADFASGAAGESWVYGVNYYYGAFGSYPSPDMQQFSLTVVPEPSTIGLLAFGSLGCVGALRRYLKAA